MADEFDQPATDDETPAETKPAEPATDGAPDTAETSGSGSPEKPKRKRGRPRGSRTKRKVEPGEVRAGGWLLGDHGWELESDG